MAGSLRELLGMVPQENGTIDQPYRPPHMEALGTLASLLEKAGQYASKVGVTVPKSSPILPGASLTLRDLTIGDLPRVLEGISYGMGPTTGGNYATGGIGTLGGMKSDVFELANAAPGAALLGKGLAKGGKALAPTAAEMLRQRAEKYMRDSGNLKEIIAYHGTPHNWQPEPGFPDGRFRLDKMGTGEGAQAYGWGAYFAESPEVANVYRNTLAKDGGAVYELDIPDEAVARMLDWDAPLSGQAPELHNALSKATGVSPEKYASDKRTGKQVWQTWISRRGEPSEAAFALRELGIPGLRFLDAGSRGAGGSGTRNIVVWDQDVLDEAARRGVKKK